MYSLIRNHIYYVSEVKGAATSLLCILRERTWLLNELEIPEQQYPLRLCYMYENQLCTVIDVDER